MPYSLALSESSFHLLIQGFCAQLDWHLAELSDKRALLKFSRATNAHQNVFIVCYGTTLEFSAPLFLKPFDSLESIPHLFSTHLLRRNAENKIGFWCLEEIDRGLIYSYMHNAELSRIDIEYFADVARFLVRECEGARDIMTNLVDTEKVPKIS